jgi:2-hydroxychromene-2-carboxylate isomerase
MKRVEFFYDYGSPYSYLASTQLDGLARRTGAEIVLRPMLLGGVFKATGNRSPAQEPIEAKRRHGGRDLPRWAAHYGVPFRANPHFPINTLPIMRAATAARRAGQLDAFHRRVYPAFWVEGLNLGDPAVFGCVLDEAGLDSRALVQAAEDPAVKAELRATTEEAVARGVFGAPSLFVGDELFFGNDRLVLVESALTGRLHA